MELIVGKKDLLKLVARVAAVAEKKGTNEILSNVLLASQGADTIRMAATDLLLAIDGTTAA